MSDPTVPVSVLITRADVADLTAEMLVRLVEDGTNLTLLPDVVPAEYWPDLLRALHSLSGRNRRFKMETFGGCVSLLNPAQTLAIR